MTPGKDQPMTHLTLAALLGHGVVETHDAIFFDFHG